MRVLTCLVHDHNIWLVCLAAVMCIAASLTSSKLFQRTLTEAGAAKYQWCFLSSATAGAAIWATHFIAMLGYRPQVPVTFDGATTIVSALIAVVGSGAGLLLACGRSRAMATITGGGTIGLSIAAMHYLGMFAYRVDGFVSWDAAYIVASIIISVVLSALAIDRIKRGGSASPVWPSAMYFAGAIIGLHFIGMASFSVVPMPGVLPGIDSEAFSAMAAAIAMVALLIVGTGLSTNLVEGHTRFNSQAQLEHIASHDDLTKVANRRAFSEALRIECDKLDRFGRPFTLFVLDLDRFKPINDTLGHPIGDIVLRKVAHRLHHAVRAGDLVARIGGDEFAVIAFGMSGTEAAAVLAERIVELLGRPFIVQGNIVELGGSVGACLAPEHGVDAEALVRNADIALYTAKRMDKRGYRLFEPALLDTIQRRRFLEADLRRAIMREDFEVVYQPVIDSVSGRFTGAEALLRWTCAKRGPVAPDEFIPVAEELGLISQIGAGVLRQACRDAADWPDGITLAVNISPVQLLDPRLVQTVVTALHESGLPASRLELEITETALFGNDELAMATLIKLRNLGVQISLDDFGTGYSSLSYLHRFPINRIKIDKSFVQKLPFDPGSASIVKAITQLGGSLAMRITAEGIETEEQRVFIRDQGCDDIQGFLISRPVGAAQIRDLFAELPARAIS